MLILEKQIVPSKKNRSLSQPIIIILGGFFTAALVFYLFKTTTWDDWVKFFSHINPYYYLGYVALFFLSIVLKAWRYRMLLGASDVAHIPNLANMTIVTLVNNLFVDLLPARSGSLAYIVILTRKYDVSLAASFSSFAFSFVFDVVGMLPLFLAALLTMTPLGFWGGSWLWILLGLLSIGSILALFLLDKVFHWLCFALKFIAGKLSGRWQNWLNRAASEAGHIASDVLKVKSKGVYWPLLLISVLIRLCKYTSLYILLMAVAALWGSDVTNLLSFGLVLFALVASEAVASMPISGIAGFGAYEFTMKGILSLAGLSSLQSTMIPVGLHMLTQSLDYLVGGVCLLWLLAKRKRED